jgi:hypothetical protein
MAFDGQEFAYVWHYNFLLVWRLKTTLEMPAPAAALKASRREPEGQAPKRAARKIELR